jgi:hypothetical protein
MLLRRIFVPTGEKVTGDWRQFRNEELYNLYSSPDIMNMIKLRSMSWAGFVAKMEEMRNACNILVRKPEGNRQLGIPRRRREDSADLK